jgi:hypothetical protein
MVTPILVREVMLLRLALAWAMLLAVAAPFPMIATAFAQAALHAPEEAVKAAFLFKFGGFVEWPPESFAAPTSPLVVGVVGSDAIGDALTQIASGRSVGGRDVVVRKLKFGDPLSGLNVIFIGSATHEQLSAELEASRSQPALTVTETEEALAPGSMINFVIVSDKVRFDVAPSTAEARHLKISSQLLSVARRVVGATP